MAIKALEGGADWGLQHAVGACLQGNETGSEKKDKE